MKTPSLLLLHTPLLTGRNFCVLVKPTPSQTSGTINPWQKSNCAPAANSEFYRIIFLKKQTNASTGKRVKLTEFLNECAKIGLMEAVCMFSWTRSYAYAYIRGWGTPEYIRGGPHPPTAHWNTQHNL